MKTLTATEASRSFAALLDEVESGEVVVVTRGGRRIARIEPASSGNGAELLEILHTTPIDTDFAGDIEAVREKLQEGFATWPDA